MSIVLDVTEEEAFATHECLVEALHDWIDGDLDDRARVQVFAERLGEELGD